MRLTELEITAIKNTFQEVFGRGEVYLFGSRLLENKRGGDIDLFLECDTHNDLHKKKIVFLSN